MHRNRRSTQGTRKDPFCPDIILHFLIFMYLHCGSAWKAEPTIKTDVIHQYKHQAKGLWLLLILFKVSDVKFTRWHLSNESLGRRDVDKPICQVFFFLLNLQGKFESFKFYMESSTLTLLRSISLWSYICSLRCVKITKSYSVDSVMCRKSSICYWAPIFSKIL